MSTITLTASQYAACTITDAVESASADGTIAPTTVAHVAEVWAALPVYDRTRLMKGLDWMVGMEAPVRERRALSTLRVAILATVRGDGLVHVHQGGTLNTYCGMPLVEGSVSWDAASTATCPACTARLS